MRMVVIDADRVVQELRTGVPRQQPAPVSGEVSGRGLVETNSSEFPVVQNTAMVREVLRTFPGGRVVIALTAQPVECPPEPEAIALLVHDLLVEFGVRERSEIALVMPASSTAQSPEANGLPAMLTDSGIEWYPGHLVSSVDAARRVARFEDGSAMPFDLFLGIPRSGDDES